jgi:hypothetical protein
MGSLWNTRSRYESGTLDQSMGDPPSSVITSIVTISKECDRNAALIYQDPR